MKITKIFGQILKAAPQIASSFSGSGGIIAGINAIGKAAGLATVSLSTLLGVFGGVAVAVAGITLLVKGINKLVPSYKSASKAAQDAAQDFEDASLQTQSTKDKLSELNDKISEIQSKGKISLTDKKDLKLLQEQTTELEKQLRIDERREKIAATNSARTSKTAANTNDDVSSSVATILSDNDVSGTGLSVGMSTMSGKTVRGNKKQIASAELNAIDRLKAMQVEKENLLAIDAPHLSEDEFQQRQAEISEIESQIETLEGDLASVTTDLENFNSGLLLSNGDVVEGFEDEYFEISQILDRYAGIDPTSYDYLLDHFKNIKQIAGDKNWNSEELKTFLETITGQDLSTAKASVIEEIYSRITSKIEGTDHTIAGFFKGGSEKGLQTFLETVEQLDTEWAHFNEDTQQWEVNIDTAKLAQAMGVSESFIDSMMSKLGVYSADLTDVVDDSAERFSMSVDDALTKLHQPSSDVNIAILGNLADAFDIDTPDYSTAVKQMQAYYDVYQRLLGADGKINLDDEQCQAAAVVMEALLNNVTTLENQDNLVFNVDTSSIDEASSEADQLLKAMHDVVVAQAELETDKKLGIDTTEATQKVETAVATMKSKLDELPKEDQAKLGISIDDTDISDVDALVAKINDIPKEKLVAIGISENLVDKDLAKERDIKAKLKVNDQELKNVTAKTYDVKTKLKITDRSALSGLTTTVAAVIKPSSNSNKKKKGLVEFQGNAHVGGKWGTSRDEVALTSELGPEIIVDPKTGRWQTVGDNGAQFTHLPKGAIIFNHKQTEQLLKYGHINSRGKALAGGNAYVGKHYSGTIELPTGSQQGDNSDGKGSKEQKDAAKETVKTAKEVAKNVKYSTDASKSAADTLKEETSNLTDWVEKVLENIEKKTEQYLSKAEKKVEVGNFAGAARQYRKAEKSYAEEMSKQSSAESIYMAQANKILQSAVSKGIITAQQSASIQDKVANGSMNISKVGENTKEVIDAYQEYYDKAVAAAEATTELYNKFQEVAEKMYQLPLDKAEAQLDKLKNSYDLLEKKLDLTNSTSKKAALMEKELENLRKQHAVTAKAAATAEANYEAARKKVDAVDDKALRGLSDAMRAKVTAQIAKNMAIDVTALTGLTADGQRAILNYNAALAAQQEAQYNAKVSALETAASMRELAAAIANQPVEKAEAKIEKIDKGVEVLDAQLEVADSRQDKKRLLRQKTRAAQKEADARATAVDDIQANILASWRGSKDLRKTAKKQGKKRGEKLSLAGIDESSDLYKEIVEYNAHIDALPEAERQKTLAELNALKTLRENTAQMYADFKDDVDRSAKTVNDTVEAAEKAYRDLNKSAVKMTEDDPTLTYDQAVLQVLGNAQTAYEAQAEKYKSMADKLQAWLEKNRDNLSAEQIQTIEEDIQNYRDLSSDSADKVDDLKTEIKTYVNEQTKRDADKAQTAYDASHRLNEDRQANGKLLTHDDYAQELASAIELSAALDARIAALREQMKDVVPGSEEWKQLQSDLESTEDSSISLTQTIGELKDSMRELDAKPLENQLNVLKNEQQEIQDRINLTQAAGDDAAVTDYYSMINNSRQQVEVLKQQLAEQQALLATLDETDEKYEEVQQRVWDIEAAIRQAEIDQAGWNKTADDLLQKQKDKAKKEEDKAHKKRLNEIKLVLEQLAAKLNDIYDRMDLLKAKGITPSYKEYLKAYEVNQQRMEEIQKEIAELEAEYYRVRSDEEDEDGSQRLAAYQEWQGAIKEYNDLMAENIELVRVTMRDAILKPLQDEHDRLEHIAAVFEGLADIIDNDMLFNQDGTVSRYGNMKMDLLAGQYQAARSEVQNYQDDLKVINTLISTGSYSAEEGAARLSEAQEKLISAMKEQKSLASDLAETLKESHEKELEQLGKIIDARKEALQAKRDYYDYDKTIRAQTKDIQALQAQIAALEGITDAESKAKRARLQSQLTEAQETLDDTLQEHMFEISQDSLDELQTVLEKSFEEEWNVLVHDLDALITYANNLADNTDPESIEGAMRNIFETFDVDATATQFEGIFDAMMEERHKNPYDDAVYKSVLDDIYYTLVELKRMGALSSGINPDIVYDETASAIAASEHVNTNTSVSVVGGSEDSAAQEQTKPFIEVLKETFAQISEWFNNLKSKFKWPGFASGTRGVSRSGLAWTQEYGKDEWIIRKSDGAILTPLSHGDGVLPADITSKLYAMAMGNLPQMQVPKLNMPDYNVFDSYAPVVNIDSSITVEGSVDATVISDMKKFRDETREDMYQYISDKMYRGYIHSGGKRRL